jgi:hypothetical protein
VGVGLREVVLQMFAAGRERAVWLARSVYAWGN